MSRRHSKHEEHVNHEAWAIPYGDLVTLLLAFFVVMYAISSVNEGQYRVLAEALSEAFGGPPRSLQPITIGEQSVNGPTTPSGSPIRRNQASGSMAVVAAGGWPQPSNGILGRDRPVADGNATPGATAATIDRAAMSRAERQLADISERVVEALQEMIELDQVRIRMSDLWLEVEIKSDLLFASGMATPTPQSQTLLSSLAQALRDFPNPLRIEGHTDDVPIATTAFPSNWELSAARSSSVARLFQSRGIAPTRLAVVGYGETRPVGSNEVPSGRDANRRVVVVVLATDASEAAGLSQAPGSPDASRDAMPASAGESVDAVAAP